MTPVKAINYLKGYTSRCLFIELPHLKQTYSNGHLWSPGKFVASVGHITLDKAKDYVEKHNKK
jgi:putative transposase